VSSTGGAWVDLDTAVEALRSGGFGPEAERIVAAAQTPTTSSSEILGELGLAILRVLRDVGGMIPRRTRRHLQHCMKEIRKTWPDIALIDDEGR
jgi:hypothetical protein